MDNITLANKKNLVGKSRLNTELNRINREELVEMRMHNNARQRFKNKYAKLDVFDENKGSEASDVVMYETHNPGFCYRRNGECRLQPSCITSSSVNMQDLRILLFTKGEIDIDKVLCLYLLTAHKCDTLRTPPKSQHTSFLARQQSPLERLIDRSRKRCAEIKLTKLLPLYILDIPPVAGTKDPMNDQRLSGKIIINTKILQIVESVRNALQMCNPELLQRFLYIGRDRRKIMTIMKKNKMLGFFKSLYGQNIISSCESFQLESFQKGRIVDFRVEVNPFEDLLKVIRQNVLLLPNSNTWKVYNVAVDNIKDESEIEKSTIATSAEEGACAMKSAKNKNSDDRSRNKSKGQMVVGKRKTSPKPVCAEDFCLNIDPAEGEIEQRETVAQLQPKIMKNLQLGFSDVKLEYDDEYENDYDDMSSNWSYQPLESMPLEALANLLSKKVKKESNMEYRNMISDLKPPTFNDNELEGTSIMSIVPEEAKEVMSTSIHRSYSLKQTTCDACLKRWQNQLPTPKISKIKKYELPQLKDTSYFSSRSAQRISEMINNEVKRFEQNEAYENAMNKDGVLSNRMYKKLAKGNYLANTSIEIIDLDEMELAKIRQEIRETETNKKLKAFLKA